MRLLRAVLRADPRTRAQTEADIDAEFEFHLAAKVESLLKRGIAPEEAAHAAMAEFGDRAEARRRCLAVARLGNRVRAIVLGGVMALLAAGAVATGFTALRLNHRSTELSEQVAQLHDQLATFTGGGSVPLVQSLRVITVKGAVQRPGVWVLPRETELSLRQLIAKCGGVTDEASGRVVLTKHLQAGDKQTVFAAADLDGPSGPDPALDAFCTITVPAKPEPIPSPE